MSYLFRIFCLLVFTFLFLLPTETSAHSLNQPPYLKINGKFTNLYSVPLSSLPLSKFNFPQDNAPENYLINQPLNFELDKTFVPISQNDLNTAQFSWDFGDGTTGSGFNQAHTYSKIGSYILTIKIANAPSYLAPDPTRPFESVLMNILPNQNYQLPKAVIKAANQLIKDPLLDFISVDFSHSVQLDGSNSTPGSTPISSYFWDFGDQTLANTAMTSHKFDPTAGQLFPVLRVKDQNGFIADTFVELDNILITQPQMPLKQLLASPKTITPATSNSFLSFSSNLDDLLKRLSSEVFQTGQINYGLLIIVLIFAFFAGGLHALTPGHGKSLTAAFLVGKSDSKITDVLILAFSLTFAHTIVIYILGVTFLIIDTHFPINNILPYFDKVSALIVVGLAFSLIYKGYKNLKHERTHEHGHSHEHSHHHDHQTVAKKSRILELFLAGVSGGLTPCVDALALLILAASANQIVFGMFLVFIFSLGLASSIIALGLFVVLGKNKLKLEEKAGKLAEIYGPIIAGIFILLIAMRLLF